MLLPSIAPGTYGPATSTLQRLLEEAATISWFPLLPSGQHPPGVQAAAQHHLARLAELFPSHPELAHTPLRFVEGDFTAFDSLYSALADLGREESADPLGLTPWGRRLGRLAKDVREQIQDTPELLTLVGPPLWHHTRMNLVGFALFGSPPPRELQAGPRWAMLTHVQYNFSRLLEWALALPNSLKSSPFHSLFQVHRAGYYPVGLVSGAFTLFVRTA
jgi:hypothetical protein